MSPCPEAADAAANSIAAATANNAGDGTGQAENTPAGANVRQRLPGAIRRLLLAVALPVLGIALLALPPVTHAADARIADAEPARAVRHIQPAPPLLHVLCDDDQPPYAYRGSGAQSGARGIYPQLAAEAFRRMGLAAIVTPTPWARAIAELNHEHSGESPGGRSGERIGVCGLYATDQRRLVHDFSAPLFEERLHLVLPANTAIPEALAGQAATPPAGQDGTALAALRGMRLGVVRGWSYGDTLDAAREAGAITTEEAGSEAQNMLKVAGGRLDGAIITREGALWLRERLGLTSLVTMAPQPLAVMPVHLAFRRQDGQRPLLHAFNTAIRDMKADGTYARIVERALNGQ